MHITGALVPYVSADGARSPTSERHSLDRAQSSNSQTGQSQPAGAAESKAAERALRQEQLEIEQLLSRDREVRTHEQAHASVGGQYAGAPTYSFTRGPDGKRYVTDGEVLIDSGAVKGDPQATLQKMDVVIRAALAPSAPSAQDRQVASQAQATAARARAELALAQRETAEASVESKRQLADEKNAEPSRNNGSVDLTLYRQIETQPEAKRIDQVV